MKNNTLATLSTVSALSKLPNCIRRGDITFFESEVFPLQIMEVDNMVVITPVEDFDDTVSVEDLFREDTISDRRLLIFNQSKFEEVLTDDLDLLDEICEVADRFRQEISEERFLEVLGELSKLYQLTYVVNCLNALPFGSMRRAAETNNIIRWFQAHTTELKDY